MATAALPHGRQRPNHRSGSDDKVDQLCALIAAGKRQSAIAARLGITTGSVAGQIARMRALGDPRIPAAGASPATPGAAGRARNGTGPKDRLAELMASGCANLTTAAYRLKMSIDRVEGLWAEIRRDLGAQAR